MKASLISVIHSSSMYWSFVSALPVTTYPPIIVRQLGHHSLKHLRPVALRPNLSKGLPLSIKKIQKNQYIYTLLHIRENFPKNVPNISIITDKFIKTIIK